MRAHPRLQDLKPGFSTKPKHASSPARDRMTLASLSLLLGTILAPPLNALTSVAVNSAQDTTLAIAVESMVTAGRTIRVRAGPAVRSSGVFLGVERDQLVLGSDRNDATRVSARRIPLVEIDTVWLRGRQVRLGLLGGLAAGVAAGGVVCATTGDCAMGIGLLGAGGTLLGAAVGSVVHTWRPRYERAAGGGPSLVARAPAAPVEPSATPTSAVPAPPALAASLSRVPLGKSIRIETAAGALTGSFLGSDQGVLMIADTGSLGPDLGSRVVPLADVQQLWVRGRASRTGALIVGALGAFGGVVVGSALACGFESVECGTRAQGGVIGGAVGLMAGGLVGAAIGSAFPKWHRRFP